MTQNMTDTKQRRHRAEQQAMIDEQRRTSVLDRNVPLGITRAIFPEKGPTVVQYFTTKHRRGRFGKHWLHHVEFLRT